MTDHKRIQKDFAQMVWYFVSQDIKCFYSLRHLTEYFFNLLLLVQNYSEIFHILNFFY